MAMNSVDYSEARLKQLRVLALIDDDSSAPGGRVQLAVFTERIESEPDLQIVSLRSELFLLRDEGLVVLDERLGGVIASVGLLPAGQAAVQEFLAWRGSVPMRRRVLRDVYLFWIYNEIEVNDAHPSPSGFEKSGQTFAGMPYSDKDIEKVGEWLAANGFIKGDAAWQYKGPLWPTLTAKGIYTVEHGRSVNDLPPNTGNVFNTVVNGQANVAQASSNVHQEIAVEWKPQGLKLLETIEQALPTFDEDIQKEIRLRLSEAREELAGPAEVSKVRTAFSNIGVFLSHTGSGTLGGLLTAQITAFLASLQ